MSGKVFLIIATLFLPFVLLQGNTFLGIEAASGLKMPIFDNESGNTIGYYFINRLQKKYKRILGFRFALAPYYEISECKLIFHRQPSINVLLESVSNLAALETNKTTHINHLSIEIDNILVIKCSLSNYKNSDNTFLLKNLYLKTPTIEKKYPIALLVLLDENNSIKILPNNNSSPITIHL